MNRRLQRIRSLSVSGLAAALAAIGVFAWYGAGTAPVVVFGGLAIAAAAFGLIVRRPELAGASLPKALPRQRR